MAHDHAHEHEHHHEALRFARSHVSPETLRELDAAFPALSEVLSLSGKYGELSEKEREDLVRVHETVEKEGPFTIGFHAEGDACAVCNAPTAPVFEDELANDVKLPWAAFVFDLPVHVACAAKMGEKFPRPAPRVIDQARRALVKDADRPPADVAAFFRHDLLAHGEFDLEDWANSVHEANAGKLDRRQMKGIDKLLQWTHGRFFH